MCSIPDCPWENRHIEVEERPRLSTLGTNNYAIDPTLPAYNEIHNIVDRSSPPPTYQQHIDHSLPSYNELHNRVDRSMPLTSDQVSLPSYEPTEIWERWAPISCCDIIAFIGRLLWEVGSCCLSQSSQR